MTEIIIVLAAFDPDAGQWTAKSQEAPGLRLMADTWADLIERLPGVVHERLSRVGCQRREVAIEVLLHASLTVMVGPPAKYHVGQSMGRSSRIDGHMIRPETRPVPSTAWLDPVGKTAFRNETASTSR